MPFFELSMPVTLLVTRTVLLIQYSTITTELKTASDLWVLSVQDGAGRI